MPVIGGALARPAAVIHQPQYLPYLGYFYKMSIADAFVYLDQVPYSRNKVQNRNAIRGAAGPLPLTVPVIADDGLSTRIADARIDNHQPWARKHWRSIEQTYRRYPFFSSYAEELRAVYEATWERLAELNIHLTEMMRRWMGIDVATSRGSALGVDGAGTELLVNICRAVGARTYISGQGGRAYLEPERFAAAGIDVYGCAFTHPVYAQPEAPFIEGLSAIDLLMSAGPAARDVLRVARETSALAPWTAVA